MRSRIRALSRRGSVAEVWQYRDLISQLTRRQLSARYKKSLLGWLWSMVNPAVTLGIYALVFGLLLKFEPPVAGNGQLRNFALYLFCALVMWNAFSGIVNGSMEALLEAGPLLRKVYFPPEAAAVANLMTVLLQAVLEASILVVIMAALVNVSWTLLLWPVLMGLLAVFAMGLGLMLSVWNVRYRDVSYLVSLGLQFLFYTTPIIYPLSLVPERAWGLPARRLIELNPLTQFTEGARDLLYGLDWPGVARLGYVVAVSLVVGLGGWVLFKRSTLDIAEEL